MCRDFRGERDLRGSRPFSVFVAILIASRRSYMAGSIRRLLTVRRHQGTRRVGFLVAQRSLAASAFGFALRCAALRCVAGRCALRCAGGQVERSPGGGDGTAG